MQRTLAIDLGKRTTAARLHITDDFEHKRREEVIQYLHNKYGRERPALIAEVISYRSKCAAIDVGR